MTEDKNLQQNDFWQTQTRGTNSNEYQIYVSCAESMGWIIKTYDEWLSS